MNASRRMGGALGIGHLDTKNVANAGDQALQGVNNLQHWAIEENSGS